MKDSYKNRYKFGSSESLEDEVEDDDENEDYDENEEVIISYACEDCDYRWEVTVDEEDIEYDNLQYCPMCGSMNTTQI
ncbi:MAG: hypothetical protein OEZ22_02260 [Spirochaetia bacterium]|nr:hypothetical protein [Spirochaetia bacterium]